MYISKLSLINYRNFPNAKFVFRKGVNTIIGENGSGKTNLFRAIRLLLDDNMIRSAYRLDESDFYRGLKRWQGHWIIISLEFEELSADEAVQALFCHGLGVIGDKGVERATYNLIFRPNNETRRKLSELKEGDHEGLVEIQNSVSIEDYETIFTGRSSIDFNDKEFYKQVVGDFENVRFRKEMDLPVIGCRLPKLLAVSKEVAFTFIQALRDVVSEFHNNRTNPLLSLLKAKSGEIDREAFQGIVDKVTKLNNAIESLQDVQGVRADIRGTIKDAAGEAYSPSSLSIKSELPDEADRLFQSLKLFVRESAVGHEGPIHELSLGGANLIYLTLKLLEFKYQKGRQPIANFLLIEEPEAHIHTHIQKTLFDRIQYDDTQIIYSTHSSHISEISNVQNMNIIGRCCGRSEAYQPTAGLEDGQIVNVQRYLDAVRSNLLFAKSVILVEGDAEEILIPILIKKVLGVSLDELGISIVNIRSTGFKNVACLFHNDRIRNRCSIITDLDKSIVKISQEDIDDDVEGRKVKMFQESEKRGEARKADLEKTFDGNPWISLFFAQHTFEVDFVSAGNAKEVIEVIPEIYSDEGMKTRAEQELKSGKVKDYGGRVLMMAKNCGKGWFAILLGKSVNENTRIPNYIARAIVFALPGRKREVWANIIRYRLSFQVNGTCSVENRFKDIIGNLERFAKGEIVFDDVRDMVMKAIPADPINDFIKEL